ncbi:hypothetical protein L3V83_05095 [Thiotrichales bacterium 19X7-9]|nr:hypothetical protein [Thiotrichales bacterium 19X7-9]
MGKIRNQKTGMEVSSFTPDLSKNMSNQKLPDDHNKTPINGAGVVNLIRVKDKLYVLTTGKINPEHGAYETTLAIGGGFNYLGNGNKNTFQTAINASIKFKHPSLDEIDINSKILGKGVVGYCEKWGNMQYATLIREFEAENVKDAIAMAKQFGDGFGLYDFDDIVKSARLTYLGAEIHQSKEQKVSENKTHKYNNLVLDETDPAKYKEVVVFDDMAAVQVDNILKMPKNVYIFDFDGTVLNGHTQGIDIHNEKNRDKHNQIKDMYDHPEKYINQSFFEFIDKNYDRIKSGDMHIMFATAGPIKNPIYMVNEGYKQWCEENNKEEPRFILDESHVVGAGSEITNADGTKRILEIKDISASLGGDAKKVVLEEVKRRCKEISSNDNLSYYFFDDELKNNETAVIQGINVYCPESSSNYAKQIIRDNLKLRAVDPDTELYQWKQFDGFEHKTSLLKINFNDVTKEVEKGNTKDFVVPLKVAQEYSQTKTSSLSPFYDQQQMMGLSETTQSLAYG